MLFKVYSKFIPNLTRKDGSAFEKFFKEKSVELTMTTILDKNTNEQEIDQRQFITRTMIEKGF